MHPIVSQYKYFILNGRLFEIRINPEILTKSAMVDIKEM
jgi:hypothetical protein